MLHHRGIYIYLSHIEWMSSDGHYTINHHHLNIYYKIRNLQKQPRSIFSIFPREIGLQKAHRHQLNRSARLLLVQVHKAPAARDKAFVTSRSTLKKTKLGPASPKCHDIQESVRGRCAHWPTSTTDKTISTYVRTAVKSRPRAKSVPSAWPPAIKCFRRSQSTAEPTFRA